ncbi:MAG: LysR substrate-binding domain-containing protein [Rhodobacterales bacterium]
MPQKKNLLPPLDYLLAFEAAANHQSFVGASQEINISETAISRKVRLLELHYSILLFTRGHRSITLTPQGKNFLDEIRPALLILRDASRNAFAAQNRGPVKLAATNSVAALWLMPRLQKYNHTNKEMKINLISSDSDEECLADGIDLAILRGDGMWQGFDTKLLFGETIFPVCSPDYLAAHPEAGSLTALPNLDLIEVSSPHTEWMNWKIWLANNKLDDLTLQRSAYFNTYPLTVQAAVEGLGMVLGWAHLVDHLLDSGKLVRPLQGTQVRTEFGYYLLHAKTHVPSAESRAVENWLLKSSAERVRYKQASAP